MHWKMIFDDNLTLNKGEHMMEINFKKDWYKSSDTQKQISRETLSKDRRIMDNLTITLKLLKFTL